MKKLIALILSGVLIVTLFHGCQLQSLTDREEEVRTFGIDFRKYTEQGFLFMPDEYYGEYEVKGIITVEMHPEVKYFENRISQAQEGYQTHIFYHGDKTVTQVVKLVDIDDLIEYIYNLAIDWGGDAFTHFESNIRTGQTDDNVNSTYTYYTISGIVIERLQ